MISAFFSELILARSIMDAKIWWALPLIVSISLVYGATRHEHIGQIMIQSYKAAIWVIGFMLLIFAVIWGTGYFN